MRIMHGFIIIVIILVVIILQGRPQSLPTVRKCVPNSHKVLEIKVHCR